MIVVDASGSMIDDESHWALNLSVARALLDYLPLNSQVGLAAFAKTVDLNVLPTRDHGKIAAELDRLSTFHTSPPSRDRPTALWDSLNSILSDFDSPRVGDAVFVISDGDDNHSSTSFRSLERTALATGLRIFSWDFQFPDGGPTREDRLGVSEMQDLVQATGGYRIGLDQPVQMPKGQISTSGKSGVEHFLQLEARQVVEYYKVELQLPERVDKPHGWKLKATGPKQGELLMFYPRELMPCSLSETATNTH